MNENKLLAPRLTERHGHQTEQKKLKSIARETIRQGAVEEYLLFFFLFPYFLMTSFLPLYLPLNFLPVRPQVGEPTNREMDGEKGLEYMATSRRNGEYERDAVYMAQLVCPQEGERV